MMNVFHFQSRPIESYAVRFLILALIVGWGWASDVFAEETVKIKILAVNPSSTQSLKTTVQQYLPPEVKPEDVINQGEFEFKYDSEKGTYLLKKAVELAPQETQTFELQVRNVWVIQPEEIEDVRNHLKQSMSALSKTKFESTGKLLFERANETLGQIEENQSKPLGIMQKVELYRVHMRQLEDLKQNALSLEAMRRLEEETKVGVRQVNFFVTAENPSSEEKKLTVNSDLPRDIQSKDVLDAAGFEIYFDEGRRIFVLKKEDLLGPKEKRTYEIVLRDIWYIPQSELDFLKSETGRLVPLFKGSPYEEFSLKQGDQILTSVNAITGLQTEVQSSTDINDRIRAHVLNSQRLKFSKNKLRELQDMLSEVELEPAREKTEPNKKVLRRLVDMTQHVLVAMGFQPDKSIVGWILFGIIIFLALITLVFYAVWLKKLQTQQSKKKPGTAT